MILKTVKFFNNANFFIESNKFQLQLIIVQYKNVGVSTNIMDVNTYTQKVTHTRQDTCTKDTHTQTLEAVI